MVKGKTSAGFAFEISDETLDDYEIVEQLIAGEDGDAMAFWRIGFLLLGKDGMRKLRDLCADESGKVKASAVRAQLQEILATKPVKN